MAHFSFQRLDDKTWGIKASAGLGQATGYAGQTVEVTKRDGTSESVVLGAMVDRWNGGRAATYRRAGSTRAERRAYAPVVARDPEIDAWIAELDDDIASGDAYVVHRAELIRAATANEVKVGETDRGSYYDTTTFQFTVPFDVDAETVRAALAHQDGASMYAYGSFGGYSTIGHVSAVEGEPRTFTYQSVYHIGD